MDGRPDDAIRPSPEGVAPPRTVEAHLAPVRGAAEGPADSVQTAPAVDQAALLAELHGVIMELHLAQSPDELYRRAVEFGTARLGADRLSIWLFDTDGLSATGTYGIDEWGALRDERQARVRVSPGSGMGRIARGEAQAIVDLDAPLLDCRAEPVGRGRSLKVALHHQGAVVGCLCADSLLSGERWTQVHIEIARLYAMSIDTLSALLRTQEVLRRSRTTFREVLDHLPQSVFWKDGAGRYLGCNRAFADLLGLPGPRAVVGLTDFELPFPREHAEAYRSDDREVWRSRVAKIGIVEPLRRPDGSEAVVRTCKALLLDDAGEPYGVLGILEDLTEYLSAQHALAQSEARFRRVVNAVQDIVWRCEATDDGEFERGFISPAGDRLLGLPDGTLAHSFRAYIAHILPDDLEVTRVTLRRLTNQAPAEVMHEYRVRRADGQVRWVCSHGLSHVTEEGRIALFGTTTDITDRKLAEEALRESEARYRQVVTMVSDVVWRCDLDEDGGFAQGYISPAGERLLGLPEGTLGNSFATSLQYVEPEDREALREVLRGAVDHAPAELRHDYRVRRADGALRWVSLHAASRLADDGRVTVYGTTADITERRQAEAALQESGQLLRQSQEAARIGSYVYNAVSRTWVGSPMLDTILGLTEGFPRDGVGIAELLHPDDEPVIRPMTREGGGSGRSVDIRHRIIRPSDGQVRWLHTLGTISRDDTGRPIQIAGTVRDVTDQVLAEQEQERLREHIAQSGGLESLGRLAGGVAHEFSNTLAVVIGRAELALARGDLSQRATGDLSVIKSAATRAGALTKQLLGFARKQQIAPRIIDLNEAVERGLLMLRQVIGERIEVAWRPGEGVGPVRMDPLQLEQILANLATNARDAIEGHGAITVATEVAHSAPPSLEDEASPPVEGYACLSMVDDGCGMDAGTLARAFEPFFTTKPVGVGTGLGLATVHGIVAQNGGAIELTSAPGAGACFRIYLPRHPYEAAPEREEQPAGTSRAPCAPQAVSGTILLVEDEPLVLRTVALLLKHLGYTVLSAPSAREALCVAREHAGCIDLLVSDVVMPEMNGPELADVLLHERPGLRCLFMSGYAPGVVAATGGLGPGRHFIQKPCLAEELCDKIREALDGPPPVH